MMEWDTDTAHMDCHSCSNHSCQDECSQDHCAQECSGSSFCGDASICMEKSCVGAPCQSVCHSSSVQCPSNMDADGGVPSSDQQSFQQFSNSGHEGSIHCPWILPGEPCDVMVDTRNALGKHIYEKHIDPQLTLKCPLETCSKVVQKSSLPNHQAQQHQLDNYLCSWNDCFGTYPTSDDLSKHIMSSHSYLDCHFGGCEVSLKDPMQLQNHVAEDHLDFNFSWPDDLPINQQYSPDDLYGFSIVPPANPRIENYQMYGNTGHHQQMHCYNANTTIGRMHDTATDTYERENGTVTNAFDQKTPALVTQNKHQDQQRFADHVPSTWHNTEHSHQLQAAVGDGSSASEATSPSPSTRSTANSSTHRSQTAEHVCRWIVESQTQSLCNQSFDTAELLQQHLRNDHCKPAKKSRLAPRIPAICRWAGCARNGEPLTDTHKLIRHALTHSDCKSGCPRIVQTR